MWVIFIASYFVLNTLVFKPTLKIIAERERLTKGKTKEIEFFKQDSEIKFKEYEALMAEARSLAKISRDEILRAAEAEQKEILGQARSEAESTMEEVKAQIASEIISAREGLKSKTDQLAEEMVKKLTERKVA